MYLKKDPSLFYPSRKLNLKKFEESKWQSTKLTLWSLGWGKGWDANFKEQLRDGLNSIKTLQQVEIKKFRNKNYSIFLEDPSRAVRYSSIYHLEIFLFWIYLAIIIIMRMVKQPQFAVSEKGRYSKQVYWNMKTKILDYFFDQMWLGS